MNRARPFTKSSMAGLDPAIQSHARGAFLIAGWSARGPAMAEFSPSPLLKVLC
jgi:hypothetical protein